jgi:pimeloyl-ACP methyl ester carboxylesterase
MCGIENRRLTCDLVPHRIKRSRTGGRGVTGERQLTKTFDSTHGRVAYEVFGAGPAVVLVHGTPSWSYLWRGVVPRLARDFTVYVYDMPGYGASARYEGKDVSVGAQTTVLCELLDTWALESPSIVGHDIAGGIVLRAALVESTRFRHIALCDAAALAPYISPFSRHVQRHLDVFAGVPGYVHEAMVAAHLRAATTRAMTDDELQPYLAQWLGADGQAAYYRHVGQLDERYTREIEPRYAELDVPTLVLWGAADRWLDPERGEQLAKAIPGPRFVQIEDAGHFLPDDRPVETATYLAEFFTP